MDGTAEKRQKVLSNSERRERVQAVVSEIAANARNKGLQRKMPVTRATMAQQKSSKRDEYKLHIGWLHYQRGRFRQVSSKRNGGNRTVPYKKQEPQTVQTIIDKAKNLFFPNGKSSHGHLSDMDVCLSNYDGEMISEFVGSDGHPCSLQEYLKSQGIYSSQFYVYLRTRQKEEEIVDPEVSKNLFLVNGKAPENISIKYTKETESLYSDDKFRVSCSSKRGCYELCTEPHLKGTFDEYCPFLDGYHLTSLAVGKVKIIETDESGETVYAGSHQNIDTALGNTQIYSPYDVHGYEHDGTLILSVVLVNSKRTNFIHWYRNGETIKSGENVFAISVNEPGLYSVGFELDDELFCLDPPVNVTLATEQISPPSEATLKKTLMASPISTAQIKPTTVATLTECLVANPTSTIQTNPSAVATLTEPLISNPSPTIQISPPAMATITEPLMAEPTSTVQISPPAMATLTEPLMDSPTPTVQISRSAAATLTEPLMGNQTYTVQMNPTTVAIPTEPLMVSQTSIVQICPTTVATLAEPLMASSTSMEQLATLTEPLMGNPTSKVQINPTTVATLTEPWLANSTSNVQINPTTVAARTEPLMANPTSKVHINPTTVATLTEPWLANPTSNVQINPTTVATLTEPLMANPTSKVQINQTTVATLTEPLMANPTSKVQINPSAMATLTEPLMANPTSKAQINPSAVATLTEPLMVKPTSKVQINPSAMATLAESLVGNPTSTVQINPTAMATLAESLVGNPTSTVQINPTTLDPVMDSTNAGQGIEPPLKKSKKDTFDEPGTICKLCSTKRDKMDIDVEGITIPKIEVSELVLHEKIGEGAFGEVFRGEWLESNIAVKKLKVKRMRLNKKFVLDEVKVHSKIRHPNIVLLMAYAINKDELYLVSECIQGLNLDDLLFGENEHKLDVQKKNDIAIQICRAVCYLHNRRPVVIHRDIKPENILISNNLDVAKLCDLGLSKLKTLNTIVTTCAKKDTQSGTPVYQAPEVLMEKKKCTVAADVWSLCCTVVELYAEEPIWVIEQIEEDDCDTSTTCLIQYMSRNQRPHGLARLQQYGNLPCQILDIITSGLDYLPTERPSSLKICSVLKLHL